MKIDTNSLRILEQGRTDGAKFFLPSVQLPRNEYTAVNKVLECIGGKWSRKDKAHVFDGDAEDAIERAIETGEVTDWKKEFQFFETPDSVADELVRLADIKAGMHVLEPSAGRGAICRAILRKESAVDLRCVELNKDNAADLSDAGYVVTECDFLKFAIVPKVDRVVMNPPFGKRQDIAHITHAVSLCAGRVVSVASSSVKWREDAKGKEFRAMVEEHGGEFIELPESSFAKSGTNVNTCIVVIPC